MRPTQWAPHMAGAAGPAAGVRPSGSPQRVPHSGARRRRPCQPARGLGPRCSTAHSCMRLWAGAPHEVRATPGAGRGGRRVKRGDTGTHCKSGNRTRRPGKAFAAPLPAQRALNVDICGVRFGGPQQRGCARNHGAGNRRPAQHLVVPVAGVLAAGDLRPARQAPSARVGRGTGLNTTIGFHGHAAGVVCSPGCPARPVALS